jgi:outer membrane protein assembly factor BamB
MLTSMLTVVISCLPLDAAAAAVDDHRSGVPAYQAVFEKNIGQFHKSTRFISRTTIGFVSFGDAGPSFRLNGGDKHRDVHLQFVNANPAIAIRPGQALLTTSNYFTSATSPKTVPTYAHLAYGQVYDGIDVLFYGARHLLEYDFILAPEADPRAIRFRYDGAQSVLLDDDGDLLIQVDHGTLVQKKPIAYQMIGEEHRPVQCEYRLQDGEVTLQLGPYDQRRQLTIDPLYSFSTTIGGSDRDMGADIAVASGGDIYVVGQTSSPDIPITSSPTGDFKDAARQVFVARLRGSENGTYVLAAATYLGCRYEADCDAQPIANGVAVDDDGNVYVTGNTRRGYVTTTGAYKQNMVDRLNSQNAFVTKLSPSLNTILYSTYIGGTNIDVGTAIAVDAAGSAYITGTTRMIGTKNDLPVTPSDVVGPTGSNDGFVAKLTPSGNSLVFLTYLGQPAPSPGGSPDADDSPFAIKVDGRGRAYIAGVTLSANFPTVQAIQGAIAPATTSSPGPAQDGFVAVLSADAKSLVYSTYLGGDGPDSVKDIAIRAASPGGPDDLYEVFVTGTASSINFPKPPDAEALICQGSAFVAHIDKNVALKFTSCLATGTTSEGIAVRDNEVWITGNTVAAAAAPGEYRATWSANGGVPQNFKRRPILTGEQPIGKGGVDSFVAKFDIPKTSFTYLTYLGGTSDDYASAIAIEPSPGGGVWTTGWTESNNFRRTSDALFPHRGGRDIYVKKSFGDRDGDGLSDTWEQDGIDADGDGVIDLDLSQYNVNIDEKDILVEADYLQTAASVTIDAHTHRPDRHPLLFNQTLVPDPLGIVSAAFANAPAGPIHLHTIVDEAIDETPDNKLLEIDFVDFANLRYGLCSGSPCVRVPCGASTVAKFGVAADRTSANCANIIAARRFAFRYALFGHDFAAGSGVAPIMGNEIIVALEVAEPGVADYWDSALTAASASHLTPEQEFSDMLAGTYMHELGHSLGLFHGGGFGIPPGVVSPNQETGTGSVLLRDVNYKPNYLSVMNYAFQLNKWAFVDSARTTTDRTDRPVDYSHTQLPTLDKAGLNESVGIGVQGRKTLYGDTPFANGNGVHRVARIAPSGAIDWNGDGQVQGLIQCLDPITTAATPCTPEWYKPSRQSSGNVAPSSTAALEGHDDWSNLNLDFRSSLTFGSNGRPGANLSEMPFESDALEEMFPAQPEVSIVSPLNGQSVTSTPLTFSVEAVAGTDNFPIATVELFADYKKVGEITTPPYIFTFAQPELGVNTVWATATDGLGIRGFSEAIEVSVTCPVLSFAGLTEASIVACAPRLAWDAPTNSCSFGIRYNVYRSDDPGFVPGPATLLAECVTATSYTDLSAQPSHNYTYVVRAENYGEYCSRGGNEELNVVRKSVLTPSACATAVESLTIVARGLAHTFQWQNPPGGALTTTIVYRTDGAYPLNPEDGTTAGTHGGAGGQKQSFTHEGTSPQAYWYSIFSSAGSAVSEPLRVRIPAPQPGIDWTLVAADGKFETAALQNGSLFATGSTWLTGISATDGMWLPQWKPVAAETPLTSLRAVPSGIFGLDPKLYGTAIDGQLHSINLNTGEILWSDWAADHLRASVGIMSQSTGAAYDALILGSYNIYSFNYLAATAPNGTPARWTFDNSRLTPPTDGIFRDLGKATGPTSGSPVVGPGGRVYFASHVQPGGSQDTLWCLDTTVETATKRWSINIGNVDMTPLLMNGVVYVGNAAGVVYAIDAESGAVRWSLETNDGPIVEAIVGTSPFYFATASKVWAFDAGVTPSVRWSVGVPGPTVPYVSDGRILVGSATGLLHEFNESGSLLRSALVGDDRVRVIGVSSGLVYTMSGARLTALDLESVLDSFVISPSSVYPNQLATGTVTLTEPAPAGGISIPLTTSSPAVSIPAVVTIPEEATAGVFTIARVPGSAPGVVTITADAAWRLSTIITLAVGPPITTFSITPSEVDRGETAIALLTLGYAAPPSGALIQLTNDSDAITAPQSVTINAGQTSVSFPIVAATPTATTTATITATYGNSVTSTLTVRVDLPTITSLTADPPSSATAGTPISWTVTAAGGVAPLQYRFLRRLDDAEFVIMCDYSLNNLCTWIPGTGDVGTYTIQAQVRSARTTVNYDTLAEAAFAVVVPASISALTADVESPQFTGTPITWTINAAGGIAPLQFKFWRKAPSAEEVLAQDWSSTNAYAWTPGPEDTGTFEIHGYVRSAGSTSSYDDHRTTAMELLACEIEIADAPTIAAGDTVWIEDDLPAGATASGDLIWDPTQKASGTRSFTRQLEDGENVLAFNDIDPPFSVGYGDSLVFYVLLSDCHPVPTTIRVQWTTADGASHDAVWGEAQSGAMRVGPLPESGIWTRLEVPASLLSMEATSVKHLLFSVDDGQAWFDHVGTRSCELATAPPPVDFHMLDTVWVEDDLPAGATALGSLQWDSNQRASGEASITPGIGPGQNWLAFTGATDMMPVIWGESIVFYLLTDECAPPSKIVAYWTASDGSGGGVAWGESTPNHQYVGPVPAGGTWTRVEVPAALLYLEDKSIDSFSFHVYNGRAWIDRIGKSGESCLVSIPQKPRMFFDDSVWIEDAAPSGAVMLPDMHWDSGLSASGNQSITRPLVQGLNELAFNNATLTMTPAVGQTLVFYALLHGCKPPTSLRVLWRSTDGFSAEYVWGLTTTGLPGDSPLHPTGSWARYSVSAQTLGLVNRAIHTIQFSLDEGRIWLDHIGLGPSPSAAVTTLGSQTTALLSAAPTRGYPSPPPR